MTCDKDSGNGQQVVCQFIGMASCVVLTVNHESHTSFFKPEFQKVFGKTRQTVFVHDNNLADHSLVDVVQKGTQSFPLEVEARGNVAEHAVLGVGRLQLLDLALEVGRLLGAADAGVDEVLFLDDVGGQRVVGLVSAKQLADGLDIVDPLAAWKANSRDLSSNVPFSQGSGADAVLMLKPLGRLMYRFLHSCWYRMKENEVM